MGKYGVNSNPNGGNDVTILSDAAIGRHEQQVNPYVPFSDGGKMRRGANPKVFDNNGSSNKGEAGGVVNNNGDYGPITYGF